MHQNAPITTDEAVSGHSHASELESDEVSDEDFYLTGVPEDTFELMSELPMAGDDSIDASSMPAKFDARENTGHTVYPLARCLLKEVAAHGISGIQLHL
jgi:hypothetical protein